MPTHQSKLRWVVILGLVVIGVVGAAYFQRETGPTKPPVRSVQPTTLPPLLSAEEENGLRVRLSALLRTLPKKSQKTVAILDPGNGRYLFKFEPTRTLVPASNEKLITAAALVGLRGPDFELETTVFSTAPMKDGVLSGDLVIRGGGDPTFSKNFNEEGALAALRPLVDALKSKGLKRLEGRVLVDDSLFVGKRTGPVWPKDDLWRTWMVEVTALPFNDNRIDLVCDLQGGKPRVRFDPDVGYGQIVNRLAPARSAKEHKIIFSRPADKDVFTVSGKLWAPKKPFRDDANVHDGALYFAAAFIKALEMGGVQVDGGFGRLERPLPKDKKHVLYVWRTPLSVCLPVMLKKSQNLYAEIFFRHIALASKKEPSFLGAATATREYLRKAGVLEPFTRIADGSGLSRANLISARQLARVLAMVHRSEHGQWFKDALAHPGESGTLRRRMKGLEGRVAAKTGTLSRISALSGYVKTKSGRWLVFAGLYNDGPVAKFRHVQDEICHILADL
ncbi:MAG TPA: D-alanyl-D-alanine carboxypeptidase/D-alanyl-D-alanine-endopeptidase [Planctomycetes bacterium]|nr:D-alanyl-D-alanine carboxypeptidase/D-alanyl-D-alanine-endopeptidase [Planctomycetota bacterium]